METKFIKFRKESINLVDIFTATDGNTVFNSVDIAEGTLVIGAYCEGTCLTMGWLRGMEQDSDSGKTRYEIANAIEGEVATVIRDPRRVAHYKIPEFAAKYGVGCAPFIGKPFACNGTKVKLEVDGEFASTTTDFIYTLEPLFKENE